MAKTLGAILLGIVIVLCLCGWSCGHDDKPEMVTETYVVQAGDTIYDITPRYMEHASHVHIDCTYSIIYPGQVLTIDYIPEK